MRRLRWLMWSVLAFCYVIVYFQRVAPGVVADRLMADFGVGGAVVGLLTAIYFCMYAAMQVPAGALADTLGVRHTVAVGAALSGLGVIGCAVALVAWRWVRDHPAELGLPSVHDIEAALGGAGTAVGAPAMKQPFRAGAGIVWRNRQTRAGFLAHFGVLGAYLTFTGLWAVPYLMHVYGMDRLEAANYVLAASLGLLVSAPLAGYVSDHLLHRRILPVVALSMLACAFWLAMSFWNGGRPPVWALYPLFAALGLSCGNVALILTAVKEANQPSLSGLAMGTANSGFLCAALLQPAMGYLLDSLWQGEVLAGARVYPVGAYQVVLAILAGFALLGLLGAWLMKETHCRNVAEG